VRELKAEGFEAEITHRTGLWQTHIFFGHRCVISRKPLTAHKTGRRGQILAFGTADSFLIWRLTGRKRHVNTDATNAARTMLYTREGRWDEVTCTRFGIPISMLPQF
jgi:glycerol kinase